MNNSPEISVVIPAYNCEKTIKETINSVLQQIFANFELIIINDGSQDATLDVISKIPDTRLKVFSYENAGGNVSRNRGLNLAVGNYVSFLDADDIWTPDKLESQLAALQKTPDAHVAYSWTDYIDEEGNFIVSGRRVSVNGDVYEKLLVNNFLENGSNPLICREAIIELGGFDEALKAAQDWDMWLRLAAKYSFVAVPKVQILYRVSSKSLSANLTRQEKYCLQVLENLSQLRPPNSKSTLSSSKANIYKYLTCKALQEPLSKPKGIIALKFLCKYFINDNHRLNQTNFLIKLLLKILAILILPTSIYTNILSKIKAENPKKSFQQ
ncbi:glycosyltransferase [Anabaena azotica]|uniref:Glycosyltransferase n=1 Tax=Anabaena azotica FACHB-119 TaxID=947527 RepID=A0ABR8D2C4_9NOST|nr:glycosyltransferase [Anabaena azotica]MBD2500869.1 glycosyltransferase [Anabaena azotica FACHB-119]